MKQLLEKLYFESLDALNFSPKLEIKKLVLFGKMLLCFDIILHISLIHLLLYYILL